jgi:hypothetical protein
VGIRVEDLLKELPKVPLTHVWTSEQWTAMMKQQSLQGSYMVTDRRGRYDRNKPDVMDYVLYCELEDLPLYINIVDEIYWPWSNIILKWRLENGV